MSEDSQMIVRRRRSSPFTPSPGASKLTVSRTEIAARHETCEYMAAMLTDHAKSFLWQLGLHESDALERIHRGLLSSQSGVSPAEADWVTRRLAELLAWECRPFAA